MSHPATIALRSAGERALPTESYFEDAIFPYEYGSPSWEGDATGAELLHGTTNPSTLNQMFKPANSDCGKSLVQEHENARKATDPPPNRAEKALYTAEEWEEQRSRIWHLYMHENHSLNKVIEIMRKKYAFDATYKMYRVRVLDGWGFKKNKTKNNPVGIKTHAGQATRHRIAPKKQQQQEKARLERELHSRTRLPSSTLVTGIAATPNSEERLVVLVRNLVSSLIGDGGEVHFAVANSIASRPGMVDHSKSWQTLSYYCYSASTLAKTDLFGHLNHILKRIFERLRVLLQHPEPCMVVFFWRICLELRDIRLRGNAQCRDRPYPLMRYFFSYLKHFFISWQHQYGFSHPLSGFNDWIVGSLSDSPLDFKQKLNWVYSTTIDCLADSVGSNNPVILGMQTHRAKKFRGLCMDFDIGQFSTAYSKLASRSEADHGPLADATISLKFDRIVALTVDKSLQDLKQTLDLVERLRTDLLDWCKEKGKTLKCTLHSRAFVFATEWVINYYSEVKDKEAWNRIIRYLDEAIKILSHGDEQCRIWAASFSKRMTLCYKGCLVPEKDEHKLKEDRRHRNHEIKYKLVMERRRLHDVRASIEGSSPPVCDNKNGLGNCKHRGKERVKCARRLGRIERSSPMAWAL